MTRITATAPEFSGTVRNPATGAIAGAGLGISALLVGAAGWAA